MFEQAFRNIDDVLRKEAGCTTELDYTEQTSWLLFLKYLDSLENQANISGEKLRSYAIPAPPLAMQIRIAAQLDLLSAETRRLESIYQRKIAALADLKKSLLHQAFSGAL